MTEIYGPFTQGGLTSVSFEVNKQEGSAHLLILSGEKVWERIPVVTNFNNDHRSEVARYLLDSNYPRVLEIPAVQELLHSDLN